MSKRILSVVAVFGLGVGFGCAAAPFVVPKASAQQAGTLTKWEATCFEKTDLDRALAKANEVGQEGWELVGMTNTVTTTWCFKRPKL